MTSFASTRRLSICVPCQLIDLVRNFTISDGIIRSDRRHTPPSTTVCALPHGAISYWNLMHPPARGQLLGAWATLRLNQVYNLTRREKKYIRTSTAIRTSAFGLYAIFLEPIFLYHWTYDFLVVDANSKLVAIVVMGNENFKTAAHDWATSDYTSVVLEENVGLHRSRLMLEERVNPSTQFDR